MVPNVKHHVRQFLLSLYVENRKVCSKQPACFRRGEAALALVVAGTPRLPGEQFFLNPVSVAVEECSLKGCLALSLLELLGFNLTFVFLGSLLVLIEVRWCGCCLLAYKVWDPAFFLLNSVSGMSENWIRLGIHV